MYEVELDIGVQDLLTNAETPPRRAAVIASTILFAMEAGTLHRNLSAQIKIFVAELASRGCGTKGEEATFELDPGEAGSRWVRELMLEQDILRSEVLEEEVLLTWRR